MDPNDNCHLPFLNVALQYYLCENSDYLLLDFRIKRRYLAVHCSYTINLVAQPLSGQCQAKQGFILRFTVYHYLFTLHTLHTQ